MQFRLGIVILAAGASERYGGNKLISKHPSGCSLIRHTVEVCQPLCSFGLPVVVTGRWHDALTSELTSAPCQILHNVHWPQGMGTSIARGVNNLLTLEGRSGNTADELNTPTHILVVLGDLPLLTTDSLRSLSDTAQRYPKRVVASAWQKNVTVPAVFPAGAFPLLTSLREDKGARLILKKMLAENPDDILLVPHIQAGVDIDTPSDWSTLPAG
ncbi:nucleotidyltransferase family protein [Alteromonas antoniana]|uniref:nucleotidyltransferase family protein n=1 Tax=Alteromonas antoniana TaxID=2803813 RepID=UPI001C4836A2|nr:nucleotidyltransferase family protein [Alteromonas antoniana]